jgi:hypothetical protein
MIKYPDRSSWNASKPEREQQILRLLEESDKGFMELLELLKKGGRSWARQTLSLYLENLEKKGYIKRNTKGRRVTNALVRNNPYVARMLGWERVPSYTLNIKKRIVLNELDEEGFITEWVNSLEFSFLNILQDFLLIGEAKEDMGKKERLQRFLKAHIQDIIDTLTFQGEALVERVKLGKLDPKKVWQARNKLLEKIKHQMEAPNKKL